MAGIPIAQFLDWVVNTGPQFLSGEDNIVNNVSRRSYILGKFLRGKPASRILQGSDKIQETLYLLAKRTFQTFQRGSDITWENPQKDVLMSLDWKFTLDHLTWDEWEYLGQTSGLSGDGLKTKYKDMAASKQQRLWESTVDGWEDLLWKPPSLASSTTDTTIFTSMESGGADLYSIPVFVNENVGTTTGSFNNAWTTVEGVSWATYSANWDNARETYNASDPDESEGSETGLFRAFDNMALDINYRRPGLHDEHFEKEVDMGSLCIATSKTGAVQIMSLHRQSNDMLIQPQDAAYPYPRWNGAPIVYVQELDVATLYDSGSSTFVVEASASSAGARYYFLNTDYLQVVFHRAKYFDMGKVKEPERKVGVYVIPVETWGNIICTSRRHQGIVYPQA